MTKIEAEKYNDISTFEIRKDLIDTQKEIEDYEDENVVLKRNPVDNKLRIYFNEGKISSRKTFVNKLNSILKYR